MIKHIRHIALLLFAFGTSSSVFGADLAQVQSCGLRDALCVREAALNIALDVARAQMELSKDDVVVNSQWLSSLFEQYTDVEWAGITKRFSEMPHSRVFMENMADWMAIKRLNSGAVSDAADTIEDSQTNAEKIDALENEILNDPTGIYGAGYTLSKWGELLAKMVRQKDETAVVEYLKYSGYRNDYLKRAPGSFYYVDRSEIELALALYETRGCIPMDGQLDAWRKRITTYNGEYDALVTKDEISQKSVHTLALLTGLLKAIGPTSPKTKPHPIDCFLTE
jgi:hypothetical protein